MEKQLIIIQVDSMWYIQFIDGYIGYLSRLGLMKVPKHIGFNHIQSTKFGL